VTKPTGSKLENALDLVTLDKGMHSSLPDSFVYDPFAQNEEAVGPVADTSFTQVLDFAFPENINEKVSQVGEVIYIGDGVCKVAGLTNAQVEDVITVKTSSGPQKALILGLEDTHLESVVMGDYTKIKQGDQVVADNARLKIPAGESVLGRVINPLGVPLDGKGAVRSEVMRNIEFPAPSVLNRAPIFEPLRTGIMVVDATIPIGKGQRELVIGDRKTGKSHFALDVISNQKNENVVCIYVGVGVQAAKAKAMLQLLEERDAMKYTTMVLATSDEPPSLQYISPYAGTALAEYFMYKGKHALIIYDDLSKQAKAYRQVSLLLKRSPGRDAYPGDIFFLHSRLLERVSKLHPKLGGGSITALPIAETQSGDVSDYIITNLMSITDGHIYLDANMMHEGILPAVNPGTSVSRIGSKVQISLLKKIGELTQRVLIRYEEVKSFETINTEVAEDTLRDINRGKKIRDMLAQSSSIAYSPDEEIILLYTVLSGKLDPLELNEVGQFRNNFLKYYREHVTEEFKKLCYTAKNLEDIDDAFVRLFEEYQTKMGKINGSARADQKEQTQTPNSNETASASNTKTQ
jgi:F-type H+/Na+-transporting ATPase subunit alpha